MYNLRKQIYKAVCNYAALYMYVRAYIFTKLQSNVIIKLLLYFE